MRMCWRSARSPVRRFEAIGLTILLGFVLGGVVSELMKTSLRSSYYDKDVVRKLAGRTWIGFVVFAAALAILLQAGFFK